MVKTATANAVYVRSSTSFMDNGRIIKLVQGEPWASSDPVVRARPELFADSPLVRVSDRRGLVALDEL